jgi:hypothetical protein
MRDPSHILSGKTESRPWLSRLSFFSALSHRCRRPSRHLPCPRSVCFRARTSPPCFVEAPPPSFQRRSGHPSKSGKWQLLLWRRHDPHPQH